jgi:hypothetical protein
MNETLLASIFLGGLAVVVVGIALIYLPAAIITAGILASGTSLLLVRALPEDKN